MLLAGIEGRVYGEVARVMGLSVDVVRCHLACARDQLRTAVYKTTRTLGSASGERIDEPRNSTQLIAVRFRTDRSINLATTALMQQFSEFSIGRSDLLNSTDLHIKFVVVKISDLLLGHQEYLPTDAKRLATRIVPKRMSLHAARY